MVLNYAPGDLSNFACPLLKLMIVCCTYRIDKRSKYLHQDCLAQTVFKSSPKSGNPESSSYYVPWDPERSYCSYSGTPRYFSSSSGPFLPNASPLDARPMFPDCLPQRCGVGRRCATTLDLPKSWQRFRSPLARRPRRQTRHALVSHESRLQQ